MTSSGTWMSNWNLSFHIGLNPAGIDYWSAGAKCATFALKKKKKEKKKKVVVTIVFDVVRLLAGVVCWDTVELQTHQRVNDGFVFVLVEFRQLLSRDHLLNWNTNMLHVQKTTPSQQHEKLSVNTLSSNLFPSLKEFVCLMSRLVPHPGQCESRWEMGEI